MSHYTYIHCKPDGTPFYVGKGLLNRLRQVERLHNDRHKKTIAKYGKDCILVCFLECSSDENAISLEVGLIKRLRIMGVDLANMTEGGDGTCGYKRDENQCRQNGLRKIGNKNMQGKRHSDGTKKVMREKSIARWSNPEERKKQSERLAGKTASVESRKKMSTFRTGLMWITNGVQNKQIKKEEKVPFGWRLGRTINTPYKRRQGKE
jgi:hypothetical protein